MFSQNTYVTQYFKYKFKANYYKKIFARIKDLKSQVRRFFVKKDSLILVSTQRSGTTLLSKSLFKNPTQYKFINYERMIYLDKSPEIQFKKWNRIYGMIRVNCMVGNPIYEQLVKNVLDTEILANFKFILFVRDPRDVLVSRYYSMGFSHPFSPNPIIKDIQIKLREKIQYMSLDEYVLWASHEIKDRYNVFSKIKDNSTKCITLKYEDLVNDFDNYIELLKPYFKISDKDICDLYKSSRPKTIEDKLSHNRKGAVGDFNNKLKPETITKLNQELHTILKIFDYQ